MATFPARIILELTRRCPASCGFCFLRSGGLLNQRMEEAPLAVWKALFPPATPYCDVYITGGEPLLRPDCAALVRHIKARGLSCGINTLGTLLTREKASALSRAGLDYIIFSLHGTEKTHDRICGLPGTCRKALTNLHRVASMPGRKTEIIVSCTICPENQGSLLATYRLAAAAGADRVIFEHLQFYSAAEAGGNREPFNVKNTIALRGRQNEMDIKLLHAQLTACKAEAESGGPALCIRPDMGLSQLNAWYAGTPEASVTCPPQKDTLVLSPDATARFCQNYAIPLEGKGLKEIWTSPARKKTLAQLLALKHSPAACYRCCQRRSFRVSGGRA